MPPEAGLVSLQLSRHGVVWRTGTLEPLLRGLWAWGNIAALPRQIQAQIEVTTWAIGCSSGFAVSELCRNLGHHRAPSATVEAEGGQEPKILPNGARLARDHSGALQKTFGDGTAAITGERSSHNPKVAGSNPVPATNQGPRKIEDFRDFCVFPIVLVM
jgi:hypothetical protein